MKKIIFALVVLLSVQFANAQVKPAATAKKAVESAQAASQDPKKAAKVATWLKLAKSYVDAYNSPKGNAMNMLGMCNLEYRLPMCVPTNKTQFLVYDALEEFGLI